MTDAGSIDSSGDTGTKPVYQIDDLSGRMQRIFESPVWDEPDTEPSRPELTDMPDAQTLAEIDEATRAWIESGASLNPHAGEVEGRSVSLLDPHAPFSPGTAQPHDQCGVVNSEGEVVQTGEYGAGRYLERDINDLSSASQGESICATYDSIAMVAGSGNTSPSNQWFPDFTELLADRYAQTPQTEQSVPLGYNGDGNAYEDILEPGPPVAGDPVFNQGFAFEYNPDHPSGVTLWQESDDANPDDFAVAHHFDAGGNRGIWGYLVSADSENPRSGGDTDYGSSPGRWYDPGSPSQSALEPHFALEGAAFVPARQVFPRDFNEVNNDLDTNFYWADVMPAPASNTQSVIHEYQLQVGTPGELNLNVTEMYSYASTEYQRSGEPGPDATDWIISIDGVADQQSWPDPAFLNYLEGNDLPGGGVNHPGGSQITFPVPGTIGKAYELHAKWSQSDANAQPWESTLGPPTSPPILEGESILDPNRINESNELVAYTQLTQEFMQGLIRVRIYDQGPNSVEIFRYTGTTVKAGNGQFERSPMMQTGEDTFAPILMGGHDGSFPLNVRLVANSPHGTDRQGQVQAVGQSGTGTAGATFVAIPSGGGSQSNNDPITDLVINHGDGTARFNDRSQGESWEEFQVTTYTYTDGSVARGNVHPQVLILEDPDGNGDPEPILSGPQERNFALDSGPRVKLSGTEEVDASPVSIVTPVPINDSTSNDEVGTTTDPMVSKSAVGDLGNALALSDIDFGTWPTDPGNQPGVGYSQADRDACQDTGDYANSPGFDCGALWSEIQSHDQIYEFVPTPSSGTWQLDNDGLSSSSGRERFTDALLSSRLVIVQYPHNMPSQGVGPDNNTLFDNFEAQLEQYLALPGQRSVILMGDGNLWAPYRHGDFADFGNDRTGVVSPEFLEDYAGVPPPVGSQTAVFNCQENTDTWGDLWPDTMGGNFLNPMAPVLPDPLQTQSYYDYKPDSSAYCGITPRAYNWDRFDHLMGWWYDAYGGIIWMGGVNSPYLPETNKPLGQIRVTYWEHSLINVHLPTFEDDDYDEAGDEDAENFFSAVRYDLRLAGRPDEQGKKADYLERLIRATDRNITAQGAGTQYIPDTTTRNELGDPANHQDPETINTTIQITGAYAELIDDSSSGSNIGVSKGSGRSTSASNTSDGELVSAVINPADDPAQATVFYELAYRSDAELALSGGLDDPSRVAHRFDVVGDGSFDLPGGQLGQPMQLDSPTLKVRYTNAILGNVDQDGDGYLDWEPRPDEEDESTWIDSDGDGTAGERDVGLGAKAFVRAQVLVDPSILTGFDDADSGSPFSAGVDSGDFWGDDAEAEHNANGNPRDPSDFGLSNDDTLVDNDDAMVEINDDGSRASDPTDADWAVFYRMNEGSGEGQNEAWLDYNPVGTFDGQSSYTGDGSTDYLSVHPNTDDCLRYRVSDPSNNGDDGDPVPASISNLDGQCADSAVTSKDTDYLAGTFVSVESDLLPLNFNRNGPGPSNGVAQEEFNPDPTEGPDPNDDYGEEITVEWSVSGGIGPYDLEFYENGPSGRLIATENGVSAGTGSHTFQTGLSSEVPAGECTDPETNVICEGDYTIFAEATDSQTPGETNTTSWGWQGTQDFSVALPITEAIIINDTGTSAEGSPSNEPSVEALYNDLTDLFGTNPVIRDTANSGGDPIDDPSDFEDAQRVFWLLGNDAGDGPITSDEANAIDNYVGTGGSNTDPHWVSVFQRSHYQWSNGNYQSFFGESPNWFGYSGCFGGSVLIDSGKYDFMDGAGGSLGDSAGRGSEGWGSDSDINPHGYSYSFYYDNDIQAHGEPCYGSDFYTGGLNLDSRNGGGAAGVIGITYRYIGDGSTGAGNSGNFRKDFLHNIIDKLDSGVGYTNTP